MRRVFELAPVYFIPERHPFPQLEFGRDHLILKCLQIGDIIIRLRGVKIHIRRIFALLFFYEIIHEQLFPVTLAQNAINESLVPWLAVAVHPLGYGVQPRFLRLRHLPRPGVSAAILLRQGGIFIHRVGEHIALRPFHRHRSKIGTESGQKLIGIHIPAPLLGLQGTVRLNRRAVGV